MNNKIIIIGGGVSGLSAAIYAIKNGFRPVILERNRYLGGRIRSFYEKELERIIDNGQHVLSAAYQETFKLLEIIGSLDKVRIQNKFCALFLKNPLKKYLLKSLPLPSPFHLFVPIFLNRKVLTAHSSDYLNFIIKGAKIRHYDLRDKTAAHWLTLLGQSKSIRKSLWEPLCISIMNATLSDASAHLFHNAIKKSFFYSKSMSGLAFPKDWLGNIFNNPAERYILKYGGEINLIESVLKILTSDGNISAAQTQKQIYEAPYFISAVPPHALKLILEKSNLNIFQELISKVDQFQYNPIITINVILRSPINERFPIAFVDSPIQWLFPYPDNEKNKFFGYTVVISAANNLVTLSSDEIMKIIKKEFERLLGINLNEKSLLKAKVIKEKRATISQTPKSLFLKFKTNSPINNLFWAGDWIDTGFPATIEGAILSGRLAIESIVRKQLT